jgi:hypothetical protein
MVTPIDLMLGGVPDRTTKVNEDSPPAPIAVWQQARRAHLVAQLRNGKARERLRRFLEVIEAAAPKAPWPRLRDIAAIAGLQLETVSRLLAPRARGTIIVSEEPADHDRLCHLS